MTRFFLIAGGLLLGLGLLVAAAAMLAIGASPQREGTVRIDGISNPVDIAWDESGLAHIESADAVSAAAGIGYAHAADYAWPMMFWRDAAEGRFKSSNKEADYALDLHAQRLGFEETAQQTYLNLSTEARALLDAYAAGVNQALADPGVSQGDSFILLDLTPRPWEPWDALEVEALHSYLATTIAETDTLWAAASAVQGVSRFMRTDSLFRARIGIESGAEERDLFADVSGDRGLISHKPTGTSSLPLYVPMSLRIGRTETAVATIPGTLSIPVGSRPGLAWSVARTSTMKIVAHTGPLPDTLYSRLVKDNGDEILLAVPRDSSGLLIAPVEPPPFDSTLADPPPPVVGWRLSWAGFRGETDIEAYQSLLSGSDLPRFRLLEGVGIAAGAKDAVALGSPLVASRSEDILLVASDTLQVAVANRLARLATSAEASLERFERDRVSPWAEEILAPMLDSLEALNLVDRKTEIPLQYLTSWRYEYASAAIGPTIFEAWIEAHRSLSGSYPVLTDSVHVSLLPYSLRLARAGLRDRFGADHSTWRWSRLNEGTRAPQVAVGQEAANRLAPATPSGSGGHPTALYPGPSTIGSMPYVGPAVWTFRSDIGDGKLFVSPPRTDPEPMGLAKRSHPLTGARLVVDPASPLPPRRLRLQPRV